MAYIADLLMIHEITKPPAKGEKQSIKPLVNYLKGGGRLTDRVRSFLIALLGKRGSGSLRLGLKRARRRPVSKEVVDLHVKAFELIRKFTDRPITHQLCDEILKLLPAYKLKTGSSKGKMVFQIFKPNEEVERGPGSRSICPAPREVGMTGNPKSLATNGEIEGSERWHRFHWSWADSCRRKRRSISQPSHSINLSAT